MTPEYTRRGLLTVFFRQKYKFLFVFILICAAVAAYLIYAKPVYSASGALLIRFGSDANPDVTQTQPGEIPELASNERREVIQSDTDIISSSDLLRTVVTEYGPDRIYPGLTKKLNGRDSPVEVAVEKLQRSDLIVKPRQGSDIIDVTMFNGDPKLVAAMLQTLMDLFIEKQTQFYRKPQTKFLDSQVRDASEKLARSQEELRQYKEQAGISSLDDELQQLLKEKDDARTVAVQAISDAESTLSDLQLKRQTLLETYRADSPAVHNIDAGIALATAQLHARQNDLRLSSANADEAAGGTDDLVAGHIIAINKRIAQLESDRSKFNDLSRQVELDEANYKTYVTHSEEARVNQSLDEQKITRVSIVDQPVIPLRPSRPRKLLVSAIGILSACLSGLMVVIGAEQMDDRFSDPRSISQELGLPVLATFDRRTRPS